MYREKKNQIKRPKTEMILNISRRDTAKHTITELYCFQQLLKTYQWAMVLQWGIFFPHSLTQFILTQSHVCHPVAAIKNSLVCINKPLKLFHRNVLFSPVWITFFCTIKILLYVWSGLKDLYHQWEDLVLDMMQDLAAVRKTHSSTVEACFFFPQYVCFYSPGVCSGQSAMCGGSDDLERGAKSVEAAVG